MSPFESAWLLLKRQTELGEHHPDLPSSQGPVVAFRGMTFRIDPEEEKALRERYPQMSIGERYDILRRNAYNRGMHRLRQEGYTAPDKPGAQIGSGRYQEAGPHDPYIFNPDIPVNVSTTPSADFARSYALGLRGHKDKQGAPAFFGVRAGAMQNLLDMNDPRRASGPLINPETGRAFPILTAQHRFLEGTLDPSAMTTIPAKDALIYDRGYIDDYPTARPSPYATHGSAKIYSDAYDAYIDSVLGEAKTGAEKYDRSRKEGYDDARIEAQVVGTEAQEDWMNQQFEQWKAQQQQQQMLQQQKEQQQQMFAQQQAAIPQQQLQFDFAQ